MCLQAYFGPQALVSPKFLLVNYVKILQRSCLQHRLLFSPFSPVVISTHNQSPCFLRPGSQTDISLTNLHIPLRFRNVVPSAYNL
jgi:hypothetical protein